MNIKARIGANRRRRRADRKYTSGRVQAEAGDHSAWLTMQLEDGEVSEADDTNDEEDVYTHRDLKLRR